MTIPGDAEGCILYTSGSTGRPKGVIHRMEMFNYPDVLVGKIPLSDGTRTLCIAGFSFVASQLDIVTPLICGGSVYIASETERKNMETLYALFSKRRITGMFMPPAMYGVMRRLHGTLPLDYVLLAGDNHQRVRKLSLFMLLSIAKHGKMSCKVVP